MPVMDEFREEREKIKDASPEQKWKYFKDYYLSWVLIGLGIVVVVIAFLYSVLSKEEEMLYVSMLNFADRGLAEENVEKPFEERYLEDPKQQGITLDTNARVLASLSGNEALTDQENLSVTDAVKYSYEDEQKISVLMMAGEMDLMISGQDVIERYVMQGYMRSLEEVYDAQELQALEAAGRVLYYEEQPMAVCMDGAALLEEEFFYAGEGGEEMSIYAAFAPGDGMEMGKKFLNFLQGEAAE